MFEWSPIYLLHLKIHLFFISKSSAMNIGRLCVCFFFSICFSYTLFPGGGQLFSPVSQDSGLNLTFLSQDCLSSHPQAFSRLSHRSCCGGLPSFHFLPILILFLFSLAGILLGLLFLSFKLCCLICVWRFVFVLSTPSTFSLVDGSALLPFVEISPHILCIKQKWVYASLSFDVSIGLSRHPGSRDTWASLHIFPMWSSHHFNGWAHNACGKVTPRHHQLLLGYRTPACSYKTSFTHIPTYRL